MQTIRSETGSPRRLFPLLFLLAVSGCFLFETDLKLRVMFKERNDLQVGAPVVYAYRHQVIGKVTEIEKTDNHDVIAHVQIETDYKGLVRTGALFVIERDLLDQTKPPRMLMDVLPEDMNNPPIEPGTLVKGVSWTHYQMAVSAASVGPAIEAIFQHGRHFLEEIETFIESGEIDRLVDKLKAEIQRIDELSEAQKKKFVEDILPELERQVAEALKWLERNQEDKDRDHLQKEFDDLKKKLNPSE